MYLNEKESRIIETVEGLSDDIMDFTRRLVAEPSTLGNESSVLLVMEDELNKLGFEPARIPIDPDRLSGHPGFATVPWSYEGRYNLVAKKTPEGSGGRSAIFNGHLDVVSPEPLSFWGKNPFEPFVRDGWLYGRGSADMKSGVAAMTYAAHALDKAGFRANAPVTLQCVIEEECSGNGTLACLLAGYDAEAVLIPEPMGPTVLTAQLGVLWFKVSILGEPHHVMDVHAGTNAIEKSYLLISALREFEKEINQLEPPATFRDVKHPLNLNIGVFKGGDWPSTVPAMAEFHGRLAFFPGMSYEQICQKIVHSIQEAAKKDPWLAENPPTVEFYGLRSEGFSISRELPALVTLNDCHKTLAGEDAEDFKLTATTDCRVFHHFGKGLATCYGPVGEKIHAENERVQIESIIQTAKVYALFLSRWCGLTEI